MSGRYALRFAAGFGVRAATLGLVAIASILLSPPAHAHGGIPRAFSVFFEPGTTDHVVLRSDVWGLFVSQDGGGTWAWVCAEAYGGASTNAQYRNVLYAEGGMLLIANSFSGLQVSRGDACDWTEHPQLVDEVVEGIAGSPTDPAAMVVLTSTGDGVGGILGTIWRSTDGADTFTRLGDPLPSVLSGKDIEIAPSDENRMYISASSLEDRQNGVLLRSRDGGTTWDETWFPIRDADTENLTVAPRIQAISPTNPDVLFVWVDRVEGSGETWPDWLYFSADGGQTLVKVFESSGDLPGLAFSPDGEKVVLSGPGEPPAVDAPGLWIANVDAVAARGRDAFEQQAEGRFWGLSWGADGLYAGTNDFIAGDGPKFTFGVSKDEGITFEAVMRICDVQATACTATSSAGVVCPMVLTQPGGFNEDILQSERCVSPSADAGEEGPATKAAGTAEDGGCGCRIAAPRAGTLASVSALAAIAIAFGWRRRP